MENKKSSDSASNKKLYLGTGGTLGILSLCGACGGACALSVIPLGSLLGAIGFGGLAVYLPYLRWPLFLAALVLSFFVLRTVIRQGDPLKASLIALLLGDSLVFAGTQAFKPSPCEAQINSQEVVQHLPSKQRGLFDGMMAKGCEMACAFHSKVDEKQIVSQPGAKVGDLVRCPVSGVVFKVKPDSPQIVYNGRSYYTCCTTCAKRFEQRQKAIGKI